MSYSEFSLARAKQELIFETVQKTDIFASIPELISSTLLTDTLRYNLPSALG
ncbi:hypothetical protein Cri9333_1962 [Crinalium epipsammum PCC 9333]|uniref:Uncharacterized protein n=1 Tax=Crinalium epipsammum PCC 9333 TaxID=1173022 RepID=K9VZB8_9CYAN|nr:hypothetical protein [Crinalium epipsammum]AFZ12842.1 hypothetical protein Cri9333_1962 [Crinalium epipsammum PCC 9333]